MHRLENTADHALAVDLHKVMTLEFIRSFKEAPKELELDFDATDDPAIVKYECCPRHVK